MLFCYQDVKAFQEKFGVPMPTSPSMLNDEAYNFRLGFLKEEKNEFIDCHHKRDIEGCFDALLDEVYVACGTALMMGVSVEMWSDIFYESLMDPNAMNKIRSKNPYPSKLCFLPDDEYNTAVTLFDTHLSEFVHYSYYGDAVGSAGAMSDLVILCYDTALRMGLRYPVWRELWNDVQRANMTKVRATSAGQSKRGTSLDVVKPAGWIGPNGAAILDRHYMYWKELK